MNELNPRSELLKTAKKLDTPEGEWFDRKAGTHKVKILEEPKEKDIIDDKFNEGVKKVVLKVNVNGKDLLWSVTRHNSKNSLWTQLSAFANYENNGKYAGKEFQLLIKGEGKSKNYTVYEAIKHMEKIKPDFGEIKEEEVKNQ